MTVGTGRRPSVNTRRVSVTVDREAGTTDELQSSVTVTVSAGGVSVTVRAAVVRPSVELLDSPPAEVDVDVSALEELSVTASVADVCCPVVDRENSAVDSGSTDGPGDVSDADSVEDVSGTGDGEEAGTPSSEAVDSALVDSEADSLSSVSEADPVGEVSDLPSEDEVVAVSPAVEMDSSEVDSAAVSLADAEIVASATSEADSDDNVNMGSMVGRTWDAVSVVVMAPRVITVPRRVMYNVSVVGLGVSSAKAWEVLTSMNVS